jgi:dephospho-CoA kinase
MLKIGLTGGIGSGKSTVAKVFETLGIPVYYADTEAKRLMNESDEIRSRLIKEFGEETYKDGKLNRPYLAGIVFNHTDKLDLLNSIIHPVILRDSDEWMQKQNTPYAIKEAALLYESSAVTHLDKVIGVYAPEALRIKRVMARDHSTEEEVRARMKNQMHDEIKLRLCDYIINNDEQNSVLEQVLHLHQLLLKTASGKGLI